MRKRRRAGSLSQIIKCAQPRVRKYTEQRCVRSRVSLILLLRNPYGNGEGIFLEMTTHVHTPAQYTWPEEVSQKHL